MKYADCRPSKLGAKHLRLIAAQLGIPEWGWPNTFNVTGRWYLVAQPEHLQKTITDKCTSEWLMRETGWAELPETWCPFCGALMHEGESNVMTPFSCPYCERVAWVYDEFLDASLYWEDYREQVLRSGLIDPHRLWSDLGIPVDVSTVVLAEKHSKEPYDN